MIDDTLTWVRSRHEMHVEGVPEADYTMCEACGEEWPCSVCEIADEVDRLRALVALVPVARYEAAVREVARLREVLVAAEEDAARMRAELEATAEALCWALGDIENEKPEAMDRVLAAALDRREASLTDAEGMAQVLERADLPPRVPQG